MNDPMDMGHMHRDSIQLHEQRGTPWQQETEMAESIHSSRLLLPCSAFHTPPSISHSKWKKANSPLSQERIFYEPGRCF